MPRLSSVGEMVPRKSWLVLSVVLFAASLLGNTFCIQGVCKGLPGWTVLTFGLLGFFLVPELPGYVSWFANPVLFCSWITLLIGFRIVSLCLTLSAVTLAAMPLFMRTIVIDASGNHRPITGVGLGYWLWLASIVAAGIAAFSNYASADVAAPPPETSRE
jgi:hypothetical protein